MKQVGSQRYYNSLKLATRMEKDETKRILMKIKQKNKENTKIEAITLPSSATQEIQPELFPIDINTYQLLL